MSIGHTPMSIRPLDKQKCPLDIHMSIRPMDEQKCPFDIQMSIRPLGKQKCPVDIQMSIRPMDEQKCPVDIQRSIGHLAEVLDMYDIIFSNVVSMRFRVVSPRLIKTMQHTVRSYETTEHY